MTPAPPTAAGPPHPYRWAMLAGVWMLYFCFGLTVVSMAPLVHAITRDLGLSNTAMGSVLGAWQLVYIVSAIPCGAVLDRLGPRRALFIATLVIALSAGLRGLATGPLSLFLAVAAFGLGGPLISTGAPKVISLWFAGKERGFAVGLYFTGNALGGISALSLTNSVALPLAGGSWRAVLVAYGAVALAAGLAWLLISGHGASRAMDRKAAAEQKGTYLQVFAQLIRLPVVRIVLAMGVFSLFYNHGLNNWLPEILRGGGMGPAEAGYWASIPTAVGVLAALTVPRLAIPSRRFAVLGAVFLAAGAAALLIAAGSGAPLALGLVFQGIARGSMTGLALLILMDTEEIGSRAAGSASGLYFSAAEIGGVLGPLGIGVVSDMTGGFSAALYMLTAVCGVLLILLARLRRVMAPGTRS